jgi:hypothetical protein
LRERGVERGREKTARERQVERDTKQERERGRGREREVKRDTWCTETLSKMTPSKSDKISG